MNIYVHTRTLGEQCVYCIGLLDDQYSTIVSELPLLTLQTFVIRKLTDKFASFALKSILKIGKLLNRYTDGLRNRAECLHTSIESGIKGWPRYFLLRSFEGKKILILSMILN